MNLYLVRHAGLSPAPHCCRADIDGLRGAVVAP